MWSHDYYARVTDCVNVKPAWDEEGPKFKEWYPLKDSVSDCGIVMARFKK